MPTDAGAPRESLAAAVTARTILGWVAALAIVQQGADIARIRVSQMPPSPGGVYATSDLFLAAVGPDASATLVAALSTVGPHEDILYVGPEDDRGFVASTLFVSALAWPRRVWVMTCAPGAAYPHFMVQPPDPAAVGRLLFYSSPPNLLRPRERVGPRLRLVSARPEVPWTQYCSP